MPALFDTPETPHSSEPTEGAERPLTATARVLFWGAAAMAITAGVGWVFGVSV